MIERIRFVLSGFRRVLWLSRRDAGVFLQFEKVWDDMMFHYCTGLDVQELSVSARKCWQSQAEIRNKEINDFCDKRDGL